MRIAEFIEGIVSIGKIALFLGVVAAIAPYVYMYLMYKQMKKTERKLNAIIWLLNQKSDNEKPIEQEVPKVNADPIKDRNEQRHIEHEKEDQSIPIGTRLFILGIVLLVAGVLTVAIITVTK